MRVLLAGGGTAGHINPALAIASVIKEHYPDTEFLFVGTPNGMEAFSYFFPAFHFYSPLIHL